MNFFMASMQSEEKRKEKKRKEISSQITSNHYTRITQRGRECQDKSNDIAKSRLQLPKPVARAATRRWSV
jgi:acetyl-CoA carboxylase carboxyltransferase component